MQTNPNVALVSVTPGVGGDDAKDWARMLVRMYQEYADRKFWKWQVIADNAIEMRGQETYER